VTSARYRLGGPRLPRLAVLYDLGAATPVDVMAAAYGLCQVVFICDFDRPYTAAVRSSLSELAEVLDVTGQSPQGRRELVQQVAPDGMVTFSEYQLAETARLAAALSLPFHAEEVIPALTDKLVQRQVLAQAGVQATGCMVIRDDPREALSKVGVPAVIKPRAGAGGGGPVLG